MWEHTAEGWSSTWVKTITTDCERSIYYSLVRRTFCALYVRVQIRRILDGNAENLDSGNNKNAVKHSWCFNVRDVLLWTQTAVKQMMTEGWRYISTIQYNIWMNLKG